MNVARRAGAAPASLRADTALYGGAILIDRLLAFLLLPLLTRLVSPAEYGVWTQTLVAAGMLVPLVLFASPTGIVRHFAGACSRRAARQAFLALGGLALLLLLACATVLLGAAAPVAGWVYGAAGGAELLPALVLLLATEAQLEFCIAWMRAGRGIGGIAVLVLLRSLLRYALVAGLAGGEPVAIWLLQFALAQCLFALVVLARTWWRLGRLEGQADPRPSAREWLGFCAPLVLLAGLSACSSYLDRFLLARWAGLEQVAVYAAAMSLCTLPFVLHSVLGFTLFPVLVRHWQAGQRERAGQLTADSLKAYLFVCVPVALGMALAGPWLLASLATQDYRAAPWVFWGLGLYALGYGVYQVLLYVLLLDGRSHQVLALAALAMAVNLGANVLLTPRWGPSGAAAAAALSGLVLAWVAAILTRRVLAWRFPWTELGGIALRAGLALLPVVALHGLAQVSWPALAGAAGLALLIYLSLDLAGQHSMLRRLISV